MCPVNLAVMVAVDRVEHQGFEASHGEIFLEVFLYGKDSRFMRRGPDGSGFVPKQVLCFLGIFRTLSHRIRVLFQNLGPDFGWKKLDHKSQANLVEQGFMNCFLFSWHWSAM